MVHNVVSDLHKENKAFKGSHDENASADNVSLHHSEDVLKEENNDMLGGESGSGPSNDNDGGSDISTSAVERMNVFQSSIVNNVRTRTDRVKKRKGSMFVTPPSSTPKRKRKSFVDVENDGRTPEKVNMDVFKGRVDFCGCEEASDEEKKLLIDFLAREILDVIIWQDECVRLTGPQFCPFLFREPVESEIINVYMIIMQKQSLDYGFEIYCMDTIVQREVLENLEKYGKRRMLHNTDYQVFLSRLTSFTRDKLQELKEDLLRRCRYVIFPINYGWHWYLLVFIPSDRTFKVWNSMHDSKAVGTARIYTKFLAGSIRHFSGFEIVSEPVVRESCRQQGATLDCGVYTCMWLECLARDTVDMWRYAENVKMDTYRARIAATILSDANGLLKNTFE